MPDFSKLKEAGGEFAFYWALEIMKPDIVKGFREWLNKYNLEDFFAMIKKGEMPPVTSDMFARVTDKTKYLRKITPLELCEFLAEASPPIMDLIQNMGQDGANYIIKLREYLLDCCENPENAPVIAEGGAEKPPEMAKITCDSCKKSWMVKKEEVASVKACIFCHAPA